MRMTKKRPEERKPAAQPTGWQVSKISHEGNAYVAGDMMGTKPAGKGAVARQKQEREGQPAIGNTLFSGARKSLIFLDNERI